MLSKDGINYDEYFLTDYELTVYDVSNYISEHRNLDELNYLACKLDELNHDEMEIYEAVIDVGDYVNSITDLINLSDNLDCFQSLSNISDEYDLGFYCIAESGCYSLKELGNLNNYFDYERYGYDIAFELSGTFYSGNYIYYTGESFCNNYNGKCVPEEYCGEIITIFVYLLRNRRKNDTVFTYSGGVLGHFLRNQRYEFNFDLNGVSYATNITTLC